MDDGEGTNEGTTPNSSGPNWGLIAGVAIAIALVIAGAVILLQDDDDSDSAPSTTVAVETTITETTITETTEAPATTPATTEAPATSSAPTTSEPAPAALTFSIDDIEDGGVIPIEFTCDDDNVAPIVTIDAVPDGVLQFALVVDDPDAPTVEPFVHWLVYNIPGDSSGFSDGEPDLTYGVTDAGVDGWFGPCPPAGDGPHEYAFALYGLDQELELAPGLDGRALAEALAPAVIAENVITASYERAAS